MALKKTQKSLRKWTEQDWGTKSGKPSVQGPDATGEVYAPKAAIRAMSPRTYASASAKKLAATRMGKQIAKHGLHKGKKR